MECEPNNSLFIPTGNNGDYFIHSLQTSLNTVGIFNIDKEYTCDFVNLPSPQKVGYPKDSRVLITESSDDRYIVMCEYCNECSFTINPMMFVLKLINSLVNSGYVYVIE